MINFSSTEDVSNLIELEKIFLMSTLDIQKSFNKQLVMLNKNFMSTVKFSYDVSLNDKDFSYLNESTIILNKSFSNIRILQKLLDLLEKIDICNENFRKNIEIYNNTFKESMNFVYTNTEIIEKFIHHTTVNGFITPELLLNSSNTVIDIKPLPDSESSNNSSSPYLENTLVISDTKKKVVLPYNINKVEDIFRNNHKYSSVEDVIDKVYTKPLDYYKFSPISRFKEAYKLITEREKGSKFKALSLAFELFSNYSLHPAIITACKSLDELDIYLACLEENDLDDFKFFNIKYDVPLAVSRR